MAWKNIVHATATPHYIKPDGEDTLVISAVADLVVVLPATEKCRPGLRVGLWVGVVSVSVGASLSPDTADKIQCKGLSGADNKDLINTQATEAVGDYAEVVADGTDGWVCTDKLGTWAIEA